MRVLVIGSLPRLGSPNNLPWLWYATSALKRLGHEVAAATYRESWAASPWITSRLGRMKPAGALLRRQIVTVAQRRDRETLALANAFRPRLTLVLKGEVFNPDLFAKIKRATAGPLVSWWVDDPFAYPESVKSFALFDHIFMFDRSYLSNVEQAGASAVSFLPCACDEKTYRPVRLSAAQQKRWATDVAFVASFYPNRGMLVRAVAEGTNVGVWGSGWRTSLARRELDGRHDIVRGGVVAAATAARIYSAAKVGLNSHHPQSRDGGLNMRTFELLAAGIPALNDYVPGVEDLLEPDRELVCYRSVAEAQDMAVALVADRQRRASIARRGQARVIAEHTYVARMRTLCERAFA
jgi:spore maturation protein CgeB